MKSKFLMLLACLVTCATCHSAWAGSKETTPAYEIESAGSGTQGNCLVRVWVYSKSGKVSDNELKRAAVHGVIFRGYNGTDGNPSAKPMVTDVTVEQQKASYFEGFFAEGGIYSSYAVVVVGSYQRVKTADKKYKVGATVEVSKDNLRKELEQSGIVKSLSSFF
jgi:hypothetical protein